nr:molybdate ABC transporter substrate-binding protein [Quisquiliibacterium transsilvanicum]
MLLLLCLVFQAIPAPADAGGAGAVTVAAASDLKFALDEIADAYARSTGQQVRIVYGSSGNIARQIAQGAPYDVFLSADERFVEDLARRGLTVDAGSLYAIGRLVLFAPQPGAFEPDEDFAGLRAALAAGTVRRFAIANPEHAPYGLAARQALEHAGLWEPISKRLVLGENVAQAAQFAAGGNTQGGIFALSLAMSPAIAARGRWVLLPESMHAPLRQRMVLMRRASSEARAFHDHLRQPEARAILRRFGFSIPD